VGKGGKRWDKKKVRSPKRGAIVLSSVPGGGKGKSNHSEAFYFLVSNSTGALSPRIYGGEKRGRSVKFSRKARSGSRSHHSSSLHME